MARLDRDKGATAGRANLTTSGQGGFDRGAIFSRFNYMSRKMQRLARRRWTKKLDGVIRRHGAGRLIETGCLHQMVGRGPVGVATQERADDPAVDDPRK